MAEWLIRRFVPGHENTGDLKVRGAYGRLAGLVGILTNALLAAGKLLLGLWSGSVSIMADAMNNLSDFSSSLISLIGFRLAEKPADEEHPYGHARYEYLAGLMVAVLIMVIGFELGRSSVHKLLHPSPVAFSWLGMGVLALSIALKLWQMRFYKRVGGLIHSNTLIATAQDSRNDVLTTAAVLVAALCSRFLGVDLDGWMGLAVSAFILISGFGLIRKTLDPLLGAAPDPELVREIRAHIMSYPGVLGTHDLLLHDYGPGRRFGSVHVEVAAENDVMDSHELIDDIENDFRQRYHIHMLVHMDPIITHSPQLNDLRLWLSQQVKQIHPELTIHDLRVVEGKSRNSVIFDATRPTGYDAEEKELKAALCQLVQQRHPNCRCVITIDEDYAAIPRAPGAKGSR